MIKRKRSRRSSGSSSLARPLAVLVLLIALCAGAWWFLNGNTEKKADEEMTRIDSVQDNGVDADYTGPASELQDAVETWLKAQHASVTVLKTENREENRRATGGKIRWTTKQVEVVPDKEFSRTSLERELAKSGGKAVLYQVDTKKAGSSTITEYDIALFDMLDKEQVYLVVTKLYVTEPGAAKETQEAVKKAVLNAKDKGLASVKEKKSTAGQQHPSEVRGRLAIVIDDCGSSLDILNQFNAMPIPLTYAVMPYKSHTAESADSGYRAGRQIFVHMPMQPQGVPSSESVYIGTDMSDSKVKATANEILNQVPHAIGMNNHQGSLATSDSRIMKDVMQVMNSRGLAYLDSRTNSTSVGEQTARAMGVVTSRNNLFIDNDASVDAVKSRLRQAGQIARENGSAIVIGHCRWNTAQAISEMIDELHNEGIDLVFATDLME